MKAVGVTVFLGVVFFGYSWAQEGDAPRLDVLKGQFEELRGDLFSAQKKFEERYVGELERLREKAVAAGNLELTLAVSEEAKGFKGRKGAPEYSEHADLARLQEIYVDQMGRLEVERAGKLKGLVAGYLKQLEELKVELTKTEKIEEAVAVQAEVRRVEGMVGAEEVAVPLRGGGEEPIQGEGELPKTKGRLEEYLIGTVWNARWDGKTPNGKFSFREGGKVAMPWTIQKWESTGKREVRMFNNAWNFKITFSDDLKTFEVHGAGDGALKWTAIFERREAVPE